METDQRKGSTQTTSHVPGDSLHSSQDPHSAHQGLFSHLPLHSQQQVRTPFPMIPIGGIQMVHSVPSSMTGLAHSARLPLQKSTSEESGTSEVSFHLQEGGGRGPPEDPPRPQEKPAPSQVAPLARSLGGPARKPPEDATNIADPESRQDESIRTCTKAIASLRIASEDPREKPHPHPAPHPHPGPAESPQVHVQHFSSTEIRQSLAGASVTPLDPTAEKDKLASSKPAPPGHSALCGASADERMLGQQGPRELPTSTKRAKDSAKEAMDDR